MYRGVVFLYIEFYLPTAWTFLQKYVRRPNGARKSDYDVRQLPAAPEKLMKTKMYKVPYIQKCIFAFILELAVAFSAHADETRCRDNVSAGLALVAVAGLQELAEETILPACSYCDEDDLHDAVPMASGLTKLHYNLLTLIENLENGPAVYNALREIQLEANKESSNRSLDMILIIFILTCLPIFSSCFSADVFMADYLL